MKIKYIKAAAHAWLFSMPKSMLNDIRAAAKIFHTAFGYLASFLTTLLLWIFPIPIILIGAKALEDLDKEGKR
ncbi:hypothetical protein [Snodgrassella alvi]|jgi:hypothetical protein|uniref:hypothetical protein n=1 Tax=Snodgrassella alvi TaxID=1196083 RepID=UPI000C1EA3BE|nr:hypothetical protein [Snodgrassella alvi]PIT48553.1 hypothetical protein BHC51_04735 [Snodgrassella alvi]